VYPDCFLPAINSNCTLPTPGGAGIVPDVSQFAADFQRPMVHQAEATLEHEIFSDTVLRVTYAYSGGRKLPSYRDINLFPPASDVMLFLANDLVVEGETLASAGLYGPFPFYCNGVAFCPGQTTARPDPAFRRIIQAESVVDSSYNAMIVQLRRRMKRGLLFDAHFTWAKAIDNGQNSQTFFGRSTTVFDPLNPGLDRSVSDFDIRRRFVSSFVWRPDESFGITNSVAKAVFGKWQLSGTATVQDGKTSTGTVSGFLATSIPQPVPAIPAIQLADPPRGVDTGSTNGTGGNFRVPFLPRNFGNAPGFAVFDFRISRSFGITEGTRLEILAESFNLFNRRNIQTVNTTAMSLAGNSASTLGNFIVDNTNLDVRDNTCGGQVFPDGTRCLGMTAPTNYLEPRSASSTHFNMREFQFAFKFHW
jgi:hypothetical protein